MLHKLFFDKNVMYNAITKASGAYPEKFSRDSLFHAFVSGNLCRFFCMEENVSSTPHFCRITGRGNSKILHTPQMVIFLAKRVSKRGVAG